MCRSETYKKKNRKQIYYVLRATGELNFFIYLFIIATLLKLHGQSFNGFIQFLLFFLNFFLLNFVYEENIVLHVNCELNAISVQCIYTFIVCTYDRNVPIYGCKIGGVYYTHNSHHNGVELHLKKKKFLLTIYGS